MKFEMKSVKHLKGRLTDGDIAIVVLSNGLRLDVTYDRIRKNLIVHQWYKLAEHDLEEVMTELKQYFEARVASEEAKTA